MSLIEKALLPSRAGNTGHCAECDGERDLPGPLCSECVDIPVLVRVEERYQNGEGIAPMWESADGRWEIAREFHPLHWGLGVEVQLDPGHSTWVSAQVGPLSLAARRYKEART